MKRLFRNIVAKMRESKNPLVSVPYNIARQGVTGDWDHHGEWRFITMPEYALMVHEWIKVLPKDIDCVVAIPRSGMIAGTMIATELDKPISTPDRFANGFCWGIHGVVQGVKPDGKILLVDDSCGTGNTLIKSESALKSAYPQLTVSKAVLFERVTSDTPVDHSYIRHSYDLRLVFDFNLTRISYGSMSCDLDGVLCTDYTVDIPEPDYRLWIQNVAPYRIPKFKIKSIVTNRKEKFRRITEDWLDKHSVRYDSLIMNESGGNTLQFKVDALLDDRPAWYWESDPLLSEAIFAETHIPTLCINTGKFHVLRHR